MFTRRKMLVGLAASATSAVHSDWARSPLRIGLTPVILTDQFAFLSRWSEYLAENIGVPVTFVARESYQSILGLLMSGQVNAAWICGYPFTSLQARLDLLCVPLFEGKPTYQAYLLTNQHSAHHISGWADLRGKVLAYSDPLSNSGWLVARAQMAKAGVDHRSLLRSFFTYGHRNVAEAVASGLADAGSIDGYVWETMKNHNLGEISKTHIVWKSEPYGFPPIVKLKNTDHPAFSLLSETLMSMHLNPTGQELLRALNLTGFAAGEPSMFESIRDLSLSI